MRKSRLVWMSFVVIVVLAGLLVQTAHAGKFHFNSISFSLGSMVMQGTLVGLGNDAGEVTLTAKGTVIAMCENQAGQQAPGRNSIKVNVTQKEVFVTSSNGLAPVKVVASDPSFSGFTPSPTPKQAGCPNGNWSVVDFIDNSTDWTSANVLVKDETGAVQLNLNFTCTTTFNNGSAVSLTCKQSG